MWSSDWSGGNPTTSHHLTGQVKLSGNQKQVETHSMMRGLEKVANNVIYVVNPVRFFRVKISENHTSRIFLRGEL